MQVQKTTIETSSSDAEVYVGHQMDLFRAGRERVQELLSAASVEVRPVLHGAPLTGARYDGGRYYMNPFTYYLSDSHGGWIDTLSGIDESHRAAVGPTVTLLHEQAHGQGCPGGYTGCGTNGQATFEAVYGIHDAPLGGAPPGQVDRLDPAGSVGGEVLTVLAIDAITGPAGIAPRVNHALEGNPETLGAEYVLGDHTRVTIPNNAELALGLSGAISTPDGQAIPPSAGE